jgi:hypothetical protein
MVHGDRPSARDPPQGLNIEDGAPSGRGSQPGDLVSRKGKVGDTKLTQALPVPVPLQPQRRLAAAGEDEP